ncbi:M48 family metallopeptidase [Azonexus caeni]|uniref:M48 family metallopeptidase n=1 Tax=Azonexus caeni TaxID=266126 RepID=UPI003A8433AF
MPAKPTETPRRIVVAGQTLEYTLRRSSRRSIGLSIDQRGLRVGAPQGAALRDIEALIRQHGDWVLDKLAAWRERPAASRFAVVDGAVLDLLGGPIRLHIAPAKRAGAAFTADEIRLAVPDSADPARVLEAALREKARALFGERLAHFAPFLGVAAPPLRLSSARTRWGSCSARGNIALNWRLLLMPPAIVDYVVCHELAHLKEMNHSPRFWSVVERLCPDWRARRLELRHLGRQLPQF